MTEPLRELRLPEELCRDAEKRFGSQFSRVEDLLIFILRELLRDDASQLSQAEEAMIHKRLRDLGYL